MLREYRYTVIKNKDFTIAMNTGYLTSKDYQDLNHILQRVEEYREARGKGPLETVVVESDWPEYEPTWNAIEARVIAQESYL